MILVGILKMKTVQFQLCSWLVPWFEMKCNEFCETERVLFIEDIFHPCLFKLHCQSLVKKKGGYWIYFKINLHPISPLDLVLSVSVWPICEFMLSSKLLFSFLPLELWRIHISNCNSRLLINKVVFNKLKISTISFYLSFKCFDHDRAGAKSIFKIAGAMDMKYVAGCNCEDESWFAYEHILQYQMASDFLIVVAYFSIPLELLYFLSFSRKFPFRWISMLFAAFIVLCGFTHFTTIWTYGPIPSMSEF